MERKGRGASAPKAAGRGNKRPAGAGSSRSTARPVGRTANKAGAKTAAKTSIRPDQGSGKGRSQGTDSRPAEDATQRNAEGTVQRKAQRPSSGTGQRTSQGPNQGQGQGQGQGQRATQHSAGRPSQGSDQKAKAPRRPAASSARRSGKQDDGDRLQKILAHAGVASRRACETLIADGHVQVNGVTIKELGAKADPRRDEITVDLLPIQRENLVYILMNKPKGYVTTVKDDQGRPTVLALLSGVTERVYPVGRLDFQSEGLLLMTNDGTMAQRLTSPDYHIPKVYLVKVHRVPTPELLDEMREGFRLEGRKLKPCGIEFFDRQENPWLKITLTEGKNQQIRKMFAAVGHPVHKLRRVAFGPLDDPYLKPGAWRFLTPAELSALKNL